MDILLFSDFWANYFASRNKTLGSTEDNLRIAILQNSNNRIVINGNYLKYLETLFPSDHIHYNDFADLMLEILDRSEKHISLSNCDCSQCFEDEYLHMANNVQSDLLLRIREHGNPGTPDCISISNMTRGNRDWILCHLAANNSVTVYHYDFATNQDIQNFFDDIFKLSSRVATIYYFDKYARNVSWHTYFNQIKINRIPIEVYTIGNIREGQNLRVCTPGELQRLKQIIIANIGPQSRVFYTLDETFLHERTIMFNNLVITSNDDISRMKKEFPRWKIDISLSTFDYSKQLEKCPRFLAVA